MWPSTRYSVVSWGFPPHQPERILPNLVSLLDELCQRPLSWRIENQQHLPLPVTSSQWSILARDQRDEDGSLSLFVNSPQQLSIGLTQDYPANVREFDVLSVALHRDHISGAHPLLGFEHLYTLFTECIKLFQPFWARLADAELMKLTAVGQLNVSVDLTKVPDTIHWLNFYSEELVGRLGGRAVLTAAPAYETREWNDPPGMLLVLQREPFDCHDPEHLARHDRINKYLGIRNLHALYPRQRGPYRSRRLSASAEPRHNTPKLQGDRVVE